MDEIDEDAVRAAALLAGQALAARRDRLCASGCEVFVETPEGLPVYIAVGPPAWEQGVLFDDGIAPGDRRPPNVPPTEWRVFLAVRRLCRATPGGRFKRKEIAAETPGVPPSSLGKALGRLRRRHFVEQLPGRVYVLGECAPGRHIPDLPGVA